jgi:hypothetical protein
MLVFFDTEFTNFTECELISIGFVSVDGHHEFYCELTDYHFGHVVILSAKKYCHVWSNSTLNAIKPC